MAQEQLNWTLSEIAEIVGGELFGPPELQIFRPVPAGSNDFGGITFAESKEYLQIVNESNVGAVLVNVDETNCSKPHIKCESPRLAFGRILAMAWRELPLSPGIHPTAIISPEAQVDKDASVGAFCVIESGVVLAEESKIYPFCYIGENCQIGIGAKIYPHATLYRNIEIGDRTIVHSGSVIGADGFGYFWDGVKHRKVPQVGTVRIGDDCEIGAVTAIDRATAGETLIGSGTKIDNLVQIAHNVSIGQDSIIAGQSGIAGSSNVGSRVIMGGGVGVGDHLNITDDVSIGGGSIVSKHVESSGNYWGHPLLEFRDAARVHLLISKLPQLNERIKKLEQIITELQKENADNI